MIAALSAIDSLVSPSLTGTSAVTGGGVSVMSQPVPDFGSVLQQVTQDTIGKLKGAESTALLGLQGQASVQQVVESVGGAQSSLQAAMAVRDRVVAAYQELSRMAI